MRRTFRRTVRSLAGIGVATLCLASAALAQDITFKAEVSNFQPEAGETVQLTLTFTGVQAMPPIQLPDIKGVKVRFVGPSTKFVVVNGRYSSTVSYIYHLFPEQAGQYEIPAVTVTVDGKSYSTDPITLNVAPGGAVPPQAAGVGTGMSGKVFLVLSVPKREVYVNEKVPLTIKLYIAQNENVRPVSNIDFKREGFDVDTKLDSRRYGQELGGEAYEVIEFKAYVYPRQTGSLTLGPAELVCQILVDTGQSSSLFDDLPGIFQDDIFKGILSQEWRSVNVKSADLGLRVLPVPEDGKPADFSGAVGRFDFEAAVNPAEVKVGDPLTARFQVSGDGSLKDAVMPQFKDQEHFKVYDPQVREEDGKKVLEQVVIPKDAALQEIPAVSFSYFDVETGQYKTVTRGPFPVKVSPAAAESGAPVVAVPSSEPEGKEVLGRDISFIKERPGRFRPVGHRVYHAWWFYVLTAAGIIGWVAADAAYHFKHRMRTDQAFAQKLTAPRKARNNLARAEGLLRKGVQRDFYDALFKTLQDYLSEKCGVAAGAMTTGAIGRALEDLSVSKSVETKIKNILQDCEMVRYAAVDLDQAKMSSSLAACRDVIDYFERSRR